MAQWLIREDFPKKRILQLHGLIYLFNTAAGDLLFFYKKRLEGQRIINHIIGIFIIFGKKNIIIK